MRFKNPSWAGALGWLLLGVPGAGETILIDFESPPLGAAMFDNGSDGAGGFDFGGARFVNEFTPRFGSWSGWSLSRATDTTNPGFGNQYSAFAGAGAGGSSQYLVGFSGFDVSAGLPGVDPTLLPTAPDVALPEGALPISVAVTNTTYTARSILDGDDFADPFGCDSPNECDWYRLTIHGLDRGGQTVATIGFTLADFALGPSSPQRLVDEWLEVDLTPLRVAGLAGLSFRVASSETGPFGINTPAYVAIDNLVLEDPLPGDFNRDGRVDAADYTVWRDTLGAGVPRGLGADGDRDGVVGVNDYLVWRAGFGAASGPPPAGAPAPEPTTLALALAGAGCLVRSLRTHNA